MNELDFVHRLLYGDLPTVVPGEGLFNPSVKFFRRNSHIHMSRFIIAQKDT